jgi:predicted PurR-regulated permease PerM
MSSKFPIKTKIAGLVITTFLLIILALSLYLFVVIKNNEREIINRSFRTLAQIGENIKDKNETYIKIIANNTKLKDSNKKSKDEETILEENVKRIN